jgi:uncharacterized protein
MGEETHHSDQQSAIPGGWVPLFPLPNVVLLPRAILPLHIFERRYRKMTAHTLSPKSPAPGLIGMSLLKSGWEKSYHGRPAIEPVVCLGRIIQHEHLPDGCYNFLLQGVSRVRIVEENFDEEYRRARLEAVPETTVLDLDLTEQRRRLTRLFEERRLSRCDLTKHLKALFDSGLPTAQLVDILSFTLIPCPQVKQTLLADGDVAQRVDRAVSEILRLHPEIPANSFERKFGSQN